MNIDKIIYETTRTIYSVEDKLSIATILLFCYKLNSKTFAELLYTNDHEQFISELNKKYSEYEIDFTIKLQDKNIRECFYAAIERIKHDDNEYFYALFIGDEFALVIDEITDFDFDKLKFKKLQKALKKQIKLN